MTMNIDRIMDLIAECDGDEPAPRVEVCEAGWESRARARAAREVACGEVPEGEAEWIRGAGIRVAHS